MNKKSYIVSIVNNTHGNDSFRIYGTLTTAKRVASKEALPGSTISILDAESKLPLWVKSRGAWTDYHQFG